MDQQDDGRSLEGAIEAVLFVSDEPVNVLTISQMTGADAQSVQDALQRISARLAAEGSGIVLQEVAGGWRLYTNPAYHEIIERYVLSWDTRRLTQAALDTLAIIAYGQPITRLGIASIRGVNSDSSVSSLIDKGLVRESGQSDAPGHPMTYSTTRTFLEKFGLRDLSELPPLEQFAPDEEAVHAIREGLMTYAHVTVADDGGLEAYLDEDAGLATGAPADRDEGEAPEDAAIRAMREAVSQAIAQSAGLVEKIDFDTLEFEE